VLVMLMKLLIRALPGLLMTALAAIATGASLQASVPLTWPLRLTDLKVNSLRHLLTQAGTTGYTLHTYRMRLGTRCCLDIRSSITFKRFEFLLPSFRAKIIFGVS